MKFTAEIALDVEVEILDATRALKGRTSDRPERSIPPEPADVELEVWLVRDPTTLVELTKYLPAEVLEALAYDALERLEELSRDP